MKYFIVGILMLSQLSMAGESSGVGTITTLYTNGSIARINFSQSIKNPDGCQKTDFYILELQDSRVSDRFYSALLAAYAGQKNVSFWVEGCTNNPYWGGTRPKIIDVYLQ